MTCYVERVIDTTVLNAMTTGLSPNRQGLAQLVEHNRAIAPRFRRCAQPILDYFDCDFLLLDYTTVDGQTWVLHSNQTVLEYHLLEADGYRTYPLFCDVNLWQPTLYVWESDRNGFKDPLNQGMQRHFGIQSGVTFCYQQQADFYTVSIGRSNDSHALHHLTNLSIKEYPLMERMYQFILREMRAEIAILKRQLFPAAEYAGDHYLNPKRADIKSPEDRIQMLLATEQITPDDLKLLQIQLPRRIRQCAYLWLKGYSVSELALLLGISHGTAQHHVYRLKQHLGATNKEALLAKLRKMELLEYFNHTDQFTDTDLFRLQTGPSSVTNDRRMAKACKILDDCATLEQPKPLLEERDYPFIVIQAQQRRRGLLLRLLIETFPTYAINDHIQGWMIPEFLTCLNLSAQDVPHLDALRGRRGWAHFIHTRAIEPTLQVHRYLPGHWELSSREKATQPLSV